MSSRCPGQSPACRTFTLRDIGRRGGGSGEVPRPATPACPSPGDWTRRWWAASWAQSARKEGGRRSCGDLGAPVLGPRRSPTTPPRFAGAPKGWRPNFAPPAPLHRGQLEPPQSHPSDSPAARLKWGGARRAATPRWAPQIWHPNCRPDLASWGARWGRRWGYRWGTTWGGRPNLTGVARPLWKRRSGSTPIRETVDQARGCRGRRRSAGGVTDTPADWGVSAAINVWTDVGQVSLTQLLAEARPVAR